MKKKFIAAIAATAIASSVLTGCTFFTHDYEADYQRIAAHIQSYDITVNVPENPDDENSTLVKRTFTTEATDIYKQDLVNYLNNNYSSLQGSFSTGEALINYCIQALCYSQIVINEADALIEYGLIDWYDGTNGYYTQSNSIKQSVYTTIDNSLFSIMNEILDLRGEEQITQPSAGEEGSTTFPEKPVETDEDVVVEDTEEWVPSLVRWPGMVGDAYERSLGRESVRRLITTLKENVADDFRVTEEDKKLFKEDDEKINQVIDTKGIEYVYPMLGETHYMYYLSGKNIERNLKITLMQEYIEDSVTVTSDEVLAEYERLLTEQVQSYTADISNYYTAAAANSTIYYVPDQNYFYVKHILLPFSSEQTASLTAFKALNGKTTAEIESYRADLANSIVAYKHVNGENDTANPYTVDQVMNIIKSRMLPLSGHAREADRAFDDLMYDFTTDTAIFNNAIGYPVRYKLGDGDTETYMQEFADASRELYDGYMAGTVKIGDVLYKKVVTDYGVHILYLSSVPNVTTEGGVGLYSYTTAGETATYYEAIEESLITTKTASTFNLWQSERSTYYENTGKIVYNEDIYRELFDIQVGVSTS